MCQDSRINPPDGLSQHPCRPEAEPETAAVPEAERDPAVEAHIAHRRRELHEALEDPFTPVTGPVHDLKSTGIKTGPSWLTSWDNLETQLFDGPYRRRVSLHGMWRAVGRPPARARWSGSPWPGRWRRHSIGTSQIWPRAGFTRSPTIAATSSSRKSTAMTTAKPAT